MTKLWKKNSENTALNALEKQIEAFTIGSDKLWDLSLAEADVTGSMAHIKMLASIGLINNEEYHALNNELLYILEEIKQGNFIIEEHVEDVHSQVELLLTRRKGDLGKKIHSGRSRNDQSLLDIKLYLRSEIKNIALQVQDLFNTLMQLSEQYKEVLIPGYTHLQLAMPSSFGLWFGAYAESLSDDVDMLISAFNIVNKNPLGSGAGYGSSFPINRSFTTEELHFESMNYNVVYAQMTRGKTEKIVAMAISCIATTLSKMAMDICLYMNQNFGFVSFPHSLTTGSSIMPHKKNPDVFELIRAKCNRIQALPNELTLLTNNLPSGYHRDMQLTKECLFPAIIQLKNCLDIFTRMLEHIEVNKKIFANDNLYKNLFTVEKVNELVLSGIPFRDAYHQVAELVQQGTFEPLTALSHTHEGSMGNLCNDEISELFRAKLAKLI